MLGFLSFRISNEKNIIYPDFWMQRKLSKITQNIEPQMKCRQAKRHKSYVHCAAKKKKIATLTFVKFCGSPRRGDPTHDQRDAANLNLSLHQLILAQRILGKVEDLRVKNNSC